MNMNLNLNLNLNLILKFMIKYRLNFECLNLFYSISLFF